MEFLELTDEEKQLDERMNGLLDIYVDENWHNHKIPTDDKFRHLRVETTKFSFNVVDYKVSKIYSTDVYDEEESLICEVEDCPYDDSLIRFYDDLPSELLMLISDYSRGERGLDERWN